MEILIFIVLGIISMLFKGKKPEDAPKTQNRQPTVQTGTSDPMRKLKEMTQEMYKDIQREFQTEIDEPPSRQTPDRKPAPAVSIPSLPKQTERTDRTRDVQVHTDNRHDRKSKREPHRGRLTVHQGSLITKEPVEHHEMIPTSEQDLIKGIIFSEILGPPKSKQ
ncbi:hypothetical protein M3193_04510 [Sporosarcina luteola]|uniref:hypothetical protein n=1 Tax=Sporosarcina luteola TaxID=582850 RepID=UPI0020414676|nr:hypothetical protein [Sporosarcina luteola]MCM3743393.1 hypothetical protein [Sporosarcina luteola]